MPETIRKKIKWATGRRKCGKRVWKSRWITVVKGPSDTKKQKGGGAGANEKPKTEGGSGGGGGGDKPKA